MKFIAHRGFIHKYPENTQLAINQALHHGAEYIEFDIQLTQDKVPVLLHDANLHRSSKINKNIYELTLEDFLSYPASFPKQFADKFSTSCFTSLKALLDSISDTSTICLFVEIKIESISHFGREECLRAIVEAMRSYSIKWVLLSYDEQILSLAKKQNISVAWVLKHHNRFSKGVAQQLCPQYIFCNYKKLRWKPRPFWKGPWDWALYDIFDLRLAKKFFQRGVSFIETGDIEKLLNQYQKEAET